MTDRVIVIGLDGGSWTALDTLLEQGVMPTLARLRREGVSGTLRSTCPPVTYPAWPSFATGMNPGRHGVFGFAFRDPTTGTVRTSASTDVRAHKMWDLVGNAGRKVLVMNVPTTFPAQHVNGVLVSGFLAPDEHPGVVYPSDRLATLRAAVPDFCVNWKIGRSSYDFDDQRANAGLLRELNHTRCAAFEHFLEHDPADFICMVFEYPDKVGHRFWSLIDPGQPESHNDRYASMREVILDGFRDIDAFIARLMERFGPDTSFILVSDHGFGSAKRTVYLNHLLERHQLFVGRRFKAVAFRIGYKLGIPLRVLQAVGLHPRGQGQNMDVWRSPKTDFRRTRAFAGLPLEHAVYINLQGRNPDGIIAPGAEFEQVRQQVVRILTEATDPRTGRRIVERACPPDELYEGPYVDRAPDVVYDLAPGYEVSDGVGLSSILDGGFLRSDAPGSLKGYHRPQGIFMACGPHFRRAQHVDADLIDIAPTVLHLFGLPVPGDMDGRVIENALTPEFCAQHPVRFSEQPFEATSDGQTAYTRQEESEMTRRLEELGYLE